MGATALDVRFQGIQVGKAQSDSITQAYVVEYLIRVGSWVKNDMKSSDVVCG